MLTNIQEVIGYLSYRAQSMRALGLAATRAGDTAKACLWRYEHARLLQAIQILKDESENLSDTPRDDQ